MNITKIIETKIENPFGALWQFRQSQYETGVAAPPFHLRCRGTTALYFDVQLELKSIGIKKGVTLPLTHVCMHKIGICKNILTDIFLFNA